MIFKTARQYCGVTNDYKDNIDLCIIIRSDDKEKKYEVAMLDAKAISLKNEKLKLRRKKALTMS
jgi:hypothetical protein